MKGYIEVTTDNGVKSLLPLGSFLVIEKHGGAAEVRFVDNLLLSQKCAESYSQIKQLIQEAQQSPEERLQEALKDRDKWKAEFEHLRKNSIPILRDEQFERD